MKKMNIFKVLMSLTLALVSYGVIAQTVPVTTTPTVTDVANYVELQTGSGDNWSGSAVAIAGYTNYFTVSGSPNLMTYDGTVGDTTTVYTDNGSTAITHVVPVVVVPDQDLNPGTFAWNGSGDEFTYGSMTDNAVWTWDISAASSATLSDVSTALPAGFTAGGGVLSDAAHFNQRYISTGTDVETFNLTVRESSYAGGATTLCDGALETFGVSIVDFPAVALNAGVTVYNQECYNNDGNTYTLTLDLTGEPPFFIGFDYIITEEGGATTYTFIERLTADVAAGGDSYTAYGSGGASNAIVGSLAGSGTSWTYTIVLEQDPGTDGVVAGNNEINLSNSVKTTHSLHVRFLNDEYSRKSDRQGTIGSNNATGELLSHVLYSAPTATKMEVELFPVPATGNIFTLPN